MDALQTAWLAMSWWEATAVALGITYVILATRENPWCWVAGFFSTAIYVGLFWDASLLMESALQVFYLVMSVIGFWQWRSGTDGAAKPITRWSSRQHGVALGIILGLSGLSGYFLAQKTSAALPYLDSFTTWAGVVTTLMVAWKILGNWVYWLVINVIGIYLYLTRGLVLTAALYIIYELVAVVGLLEWTRRYRAQS